MIKKILKILTMISMLSVMMMVVMMMALEIVGKCRAMSASLRSDNCNCDYHSFNEKLCLRLLLVMMMTLMMMTAPLTRSLMTMIGRWKWKRSLSEIGITPRSLQAESPPSSNP